MTVQKIVNGKLLNMTPAEIADWEKGQYQYEAGRSDMISAEVRNQRDRLLQDTDWMALSDNTMTTAWASYRQALRDITSQEGFPYSVTWPTKP